MALAVQSGVRGAVNRWLERSPDPAYGLADPFAGTALATRDTSVAWMSFMGIPQEGQGIDQYDKLASYSMAPADVAWVYACVNRVATAASSVRLRVYIQQGRDLVPWEDSPTPAAEDYQQLLDTVNPVDMSGSELRFNTAASRKVWGGWYWKRVRGRLLHDTQELYWLRVPDVTPKSTDGRAIDYYEYRPGNNAGIMGAPEIIETADMIRHRGLNMQSQIDMVSPLSAARFDMVTDEAAAMQTASILRRRGVPEGYWKAAQGAIITPQDKSAIRRWLKQLVGPRNAGKSLVAPDIEYQALSLPEKDAQWLMARKTSRLMVSAILGCPLVLVGDDEHAGVYRSVFDAQRVFWKDTMIPDLDADADTVNNWLTPEFNRPGDPKLVVAYDYSNVEAIRPTWKDEWDGWLSGIDRQAITPNRFIQHFKLGPDVPWGDAPVPRTTVTYRPQGDPNVPVVLPFMEPQNVAPDAPVGENTGGAAIEGDLPTTMRSIRKLYANPAVRAFLASEGPLNTMALLGRVIVDEDREVIEDGLRKRSSAEQIGDALALRAKGDVVEAVLAALRKQWPEAELEIIRQGKWTFDPKFPMDKINAARRPIARNPKIVAGVEAALKVGAPIAPVTLIHTKVIDKGGYEPIDGWHRTLANEHAGNKTIAAYVGEGDPDWTTQMIAFDDQIPTPPDSAVKMADVLQMADKFANALLHQPAPIVNVSPTPPVVVPAPVVNLPAPPKVKPVRTVKRVIRDDEGNIVEVREDPA